MKELFGIPLDTLLVVLAIALGAGLVGVGALALRNPILLKLGIRNAGRRRARSALIVLGLMLGTMMMTAALATGDTMSHTIRTSAVRALGQTDEIVSPKGADRARPSSLGRRPVSSWSTRPRRLVSKMRSSDRILSTASRRPSSSPWPFRILRRRRTSPG